MLVLVGTLSILLFAGSAVAQKIASPNSTPATPKEPSNLAEAAGRYLAAVEQLNILKMSRCGYAIKKRQLPSYDKLSTDVILPAFPANARGEAATALRSLKGGTNMQGQEFFDRIYVYYTQNEQLDNNTACGMIAAAFITSAKLSEEAFERKAAQR